MPIVITSPGKFYGGIAGIVVLGVLLWFRLSIAGATVQQTGDFAIDAGTSSRAVIKNLHDEGYASNQLALKYYSWRSNAASKIQAGVYHLEVGDSLKDVVKKLVSGETVDSELTITFPEGFTLDQIAQRTAEKGIGTKEEFLALAKNPSEFAGEYPFLANLPTGRTLEGYLFPDTYRVFQDDEPRDVILRMLVNFERRVVENSDIVAQSIDDVVIMASIVEREVQTDDDMALVAGVLWKRIEIGEGLFADATIRYALNKPTGGLTVADLAYDSPYNTRLYRGLPPGPVSSPGLRAIMAAASPQASDFLYYLSAPNGQTIFAKTNAEHNLNKAKYLQ